MASSVEALRFVRACVCVCEKRERERESKVAPKFNLTLPLSNSQDCDGTDTDGDQVPDMCDLCPLTFNPLQHPGGCEGVEGACVTEWMEGVLWSSTSPGHSDTKPCRFPSTG